MKKLALPLLLAACGCVTLTSKGSKVRLTQDPAEIEGCKSLEKIRPDAPYLVRSEAIKQLKNRAGEDGADVLLLTGSGWEGGDAATEYDCSRRKKTKE